MKVAIIGSRSFTSYEFLCRQLSTLPVSEVISGGARGADSLAARFARERGLPLHLFHPAYSRYGRSAPLVRNKAIMASAQLVAAFWDGHSTGTAHALSLARQRGLVCHTFWPS
jgi:hypothetical protein